MTVADTDIRSTEALLAQVVGHAADFLATLDDGPVGSRADPQQLRARLAVPLQIEAQEPDTVIRELADAAQAGLTLMPSGRYFGFVIGGVLPAALAADWLTSAWDQNAGLFAPTPAASIVEEVVGGWLKELLRLPNDASFGLVTGGQMATFTCLAAARHHVLAKAGWNVEQRGLVGAPRVRVIVGAHRHVTIDRALRFLGLGTDCVEPVVTDEDGRMLPDALKATLSDVTAPTIVCAQIGEVNSGAVDDLSAICDVTERAGAWLHVDGAFGLWAAASPQLRHLVDGVERADSWSADCHKWLNVPYDCGVAVCAHPASHRAAMEAHAAYLPHSAETGPRDPMDWNPEFSRRARAFTVYAALRSLGSSGVAALVERCCGHARAFAERLAASPHAKVLNEVTLNQVLVRFVHPTGGDDDAHTHNVIERVQQSGVCWMGGTTWRGVHAMRISVSNWRTTEEDVERSVAAILAAATDA
jgi:glutamate/tyrosine decarboxylase-like PLP-dependent enzyme